MEQVKNFILIQMQELQKHLEFSFLEKSIPGQFGAKEGERHQFKDGWYVKEGGKWKKEKQQKQPGQQEQPNIQEKKPVEEKKIFKTADEAIEGEFGEKMLPFTDISIDSVMAHGKEGPLMDKLKKIKEQGFNTLKEYGESKISKEQPIQNQPQQKPEEQKPEVQQKLTKVVDKVDDIINSKDDMLTKVGKLSQMGFTDNEILVKLSGAPLSQVLIHKKENKVEDKVSVETQKKVADEADMPKLDVQDRWDKYKLNIEMLLEGVGKRKGVLAYGPGGLGKTYNLNEVLKTYKKPDGSPLVGYNPEMDMSPDEYDYVIIGGKSTMAAIYPTLYQHNGKLIIYDDCDSIFDTDDGINLFKKTLDTTDSFASYKSSSPLKDDFGNKVPSTFKFTGKCIFITNKKAEKWNENEDLAALKSRCFPADLTMSQSETMDMLKNILYKIPFENEEGVTLDVSNEDREAAFDFLNKYKDVVPINKLNARTLGGIILQKWYKEKHPEKYPNLTWQKLAIGTIKD